MTQKEAVMKRLTAEELEARITTRKVFRFRIYPTPKQETELRQWQSALRFLWNLALEQYKIGMSRPRGERVYPTKFSQSSELTTLRADHEWLAAVPRDCSEQVLRVLDDSWRRCFDGLARAPRWKRRGGQPVGIRQPYGKRAWSLHGQSLKFPRLGDVRVVAHRSLVGTPRACTIISDGDQWFASIICETTVTAPAPRHEPRVALDRGVINLTADSDGKLTESPRFYHHTRALLARAQRNIARKQKGSKNREKAKLRVARLHRKVRRQRERPARRAKR